MLAYMAPVCQKTLEAPADRYSQCWQCLKATCLS